MKHVLLMALGLATLFPGSGFASHPDDGRTTALPNGLYLHDDSSPSCPNFSVWSETNGHPGLQRSPEIDRERQVVTLRADTLEYATAIICF